MQIDEIWVRNFEDAEQICNALRRNKLLLSSFHTFVHMLVDLFERNGTVFVCGNGGSHCDAMHFAEEFTGRFKKDREPLGALALGDPSHMTCVGNDFGFDHIFERQIRALGRPGDVLVGISTSGNSKNVALALEAARVKGLKTVGLLGKDGGSIKNIVDVALIVDASQTARVQEAHIKIIHTVIEAVEQLLFDPLTMERLKQ